MKIGAKHIIIPKVQTEPLGQRLTIPYSATKDLTEKAIQAYLHIETALGPEEAFLKKFKGTHKNICL